MSKKIVPRPYTGDLNDLVKFVGEPIVSCWIILFQGVPYKFDKSQVHRTEGLAKACLKNAIHANFCQGHYWHENTNNTFAQEKGWMRNKGFTAGLEEEFKQMAVEMTEWLLTEKIFEIKQLI